jgi:hypothetical protein
MLQAAKSAHERGAWRVRARSLSSDVATLCSRPADVQPAADLPLRWARRQHSWSVADNGTASERNCGEGKHGEASKSGDGTPRRKSRFRQARRDPSAGGLSDTPRPEEQQSW